MHLKRFKFVHLYQRENGVDMEVRRIDRWCIFVSLVTNVMLALGAQAVGECDFCTGGVRVFPIANVVARSNKEHIRGGLSERIRKNTTTELKLLRSTARRHLLYAASFW